MRIGNLKIGHAVRIKWVDSQAFKGWFHDGNAPHEHGQVVTIGYIVAVDKSQITITHSLATTGDALDPCTIPMRSVVSIERMKGWDR